MKQSKTEQLNELLKKWEMAQIEESDENWENKTKGNVQFLTKYHFCRDGIIDEAIFEKENKKVLFISNEANDDEKTSANRLKTDRINDFNEYFREKEDCWNGKLRETVCAFYKVIIQDYEIPEYKVAKNFAFMNINKRGGKGSINDDNYKRGNKNHIEEYCKYYAEYIKKEIEIIDPDIIVWLGTNTYDMNLHIKYLGAKKTEDGKVYLNNVPILRMWHTSHFRMRNQSNGKFENKLLGKFAAKLEEEMKRYNI